MDQVHPPIDLQIPPGNAWAVAVSGGADSVALLLHLSDKPNLHLHVVHLDHELRGPASDADAAFVKALSARLNIPFHIARRNEIEPTLNDLPANPSARYREIRLALFRRIVDEHNLSGVILAHHADDVAETTLQRLLRGSSAAGLAGMSSDTRVGQLRIIRPLLGIRCEALRAMLTSRGQDWREDASNESDDYLRNRLRKILRDRPALTASLLNLAAACRTLKDWTTRTATDLPPTFSAAALAGQPPLLARQSARHWLQSEGSPPQELTPAVLDRLVNMAADAATPGLQQFPGGLSVRRRSGKIQAEIGTIG